MVYTRLLATTHHQRLCSIECNMLGDMHKTPTLLQAEINTWVVLSVALPGMTSDPNVMLPAASVGMLLAIGTAGLTVSLHSLTATEHLT